MDATVFIVTDTEVKNVAKAVLSYTKQDPLLESSVCLQYRHVLSIKYPNMIGPGMPPMSLAIIDCSPIAIDLCSIFTLLNVTAVFGIETKNVRNMLKKQVGKK